MSDQLNSRDTPAVAATLIVAAFQRYNERFHSITARARGHFEQRAWAAGRRDAVARIELYEQEVTATVTALERLLNEQLHDADMWSAIRQNYTEQIKALDDNEFYKTFFSSLTRRALRTVGVNPQAEFTALEVKPTRHAEAQVDQVSYTLRGPLHYVFDEVLADFAFATPYRNTDRTIHYLSAEVRGYCAAEHPGTKLQKIELLRAVFYRGRRAYVVGRLRADRWTSPFVIALKNSADGIFADAIICSDNDVSMLFGFTRSYFHVDLKAVGPVVSFLKRLLPHKPTAEIYTVLGRAKQGKTERYRHLFSHLSQSDDLFEHAAGEKGMVMEVFTLPSYDVVFKLIRDRFAYPKTMSRADVKGKYQLVFKRDRAGRLVDAQEFRRLEFDCDRFQPALLAALLDGCSMSCELEGDKLVINHLYIERRLTPLNIYLRTADAEAEAAAAIDYGQALRDLANSNIFAGDLLLKNFGVTRHGRVIFYDYDELCLVTECNFRKLPPPEDAMDEMRADAWFYVGPNDIFPEQFVQFLGFSDNARQAFMRHHAEVLNAHYWSALKADLNRGILREVLPYASRTWASAIRRGFYLSRPAPID